jgi:hypothetical protein
MKEITVAKTYVVRLAVLWEERGGRRHFENANESVKRV